MIGEDEHGRLTITLESYNDLVKAHTKAQNKLQDIGFAIADVINLQLNIDLFFEKIIEIWSRD